VCGGFGWIYLAKNRHLDDRYVALKGLVNTGDAASARLAVHESQVLAASEHPNLVRIYNVVTHPDPHSPAKTTATS
jgi:serine/threonine-protein kinase PknG